jgi:NitT/TauT family transport system permease protein
MAVIYLVSPQRNIELSQISISIITLATLNTLSRLVVAYGISLLVSIPIALLITHSEKTEKFFLPIVDIVQSIPVLAFFPVVILFFIKFSFYDGAAIFILFMAMVWNMVFSMIGGLKTIPQDINDAAKVFGAKGIKKLIYVTIPSIFPSIITGSFLAWGQGWNISIVAEALHAFLPNGTKSNDLFGLGSLLVNSFSSSKNAVFFASLAAMIIVITLFNFFIWQKLLHLSERYKFD